MNKDYPIMYGSMRGTLTGLAYCYEIPGVEIKDAQAFHKWLAERANNSDAWAEKFTQKINQKSS
jgi:hypothetical protein